MPGDLGKVIRASLSASYRYIPRKTADGISTQLTGALEFDLVTTVPPWDRDNVGVQYVWRALADHLAARIQAGEFPPGSMLPGERELSEQYGVGVGTFRRAVRELRDRGIVTTLAAKGTFVRLAHRR